MILERTCLICKKKMQINVPAAGYIKWQQGSLIQNAMPELSVSDREILISGICGSCFDLSFSEE